MEDSKMLKIQDLWSGLKLKEKTPIYEPQPLIHSFQTAGTRFPILVGRLETEHWLSMSAPAGMDPLIHLGIASLTGNRGKNEDTALVFLSQIDSENDCVPVCFAVAADGMGGKWGGEYASSIAAETLAERVINLVIPSQIFEKQILPDQTIIRDTLIEAMTSAHEMVQCHVPEGGTTATCVLIVGDQAQIAHVGDSRAYLMNDARLQLLTSDHSLVHVLEKQGNLTSDQARTHSQRNILYRTIGMKGDLEIDSLTLWLEPSSLILLCSDGLWNALGDRQMAEIIIAAGEPQTACEQLVSAGVAADGSDNVTAIIVQIPD
jgi:serine/threonine protein phosphatase PrpC